MPNSYRSQQIPAPVPVIGNGNGKNNVNPYLTASLASTLRISSSNDSTESSSPGTTIPGPGVGSGSGLTPVRSPVRIETEELNDTPGESDPSAIKMDLSTLPKSYLEVSLSSASSVCSVVLMDLRHIPTLHSCWWYLFPPRQKS
jgi:hypothetical protein